MQILLVMYKTRTSVDSALEKPLEPGKGGRQKDGSETGLQNRKHAYVIKMVCLWTWCE